MTEVTFDFTGRSVIVTGAGRGIGLELARVFANNGANTYLVDVDHEVITAAGAEVGGTGLQADVANTADVQRVVDTVIAETSRVDILVNNAGILRDKVLWKLTDEGLGTPCWRCILGGTFRFTRACTPHFRAAGYGRGHQCHVIHRAARQLRAGELCGGQGGDHRLPPRRRRRSSRTLE